MFNLFRNKKIHIIPTRTSTPFQPHQTDVVDSDVDSYIAIPVNYQSVVLCQNTNQYESCNPTPATDITTTSSEQPNSNMSPCNFLDNCNVPDVESSSIDLAMEELDNLPRRGRSNAIVEDVRDSEKKATVEENKVVQAQQKNEEKNLDSVYPFDEESTPDNDGFCM